ncbi:MAG: glycosyltransferase family 2 protein [Flavobacteriales bacterium]|nr:glycosyltransferase family 2 protein [Flavobacteriales bacterium]MCB9335420.1 glycosyltransferase family 2 protein [Flavobacteriales bacterium]
MEGNSKISVVIPVYNSSATISELVDRLIKTFDTLTNYQYELIFVNDGSTDDSWKLLKEERAKYPDVIKAINFTKNYGQHNALLCGFSFCSGDFVVTMDDDLQHPPEEIFKLIEAQKLNNADIVYGMPIVKQHSKIRNLGSLFIRKTSNYKRQTQEGGSSFRLIRRNLTNVLVEKHSQHFLFLDAALNWYSTNIELVNVKHDPRKYGRTGYTFMKLLNIYLNIMYYYSTKPLKVIIVLGLFSSLVSFVLGLRFIYRKLMFDVPLGYTSIIVAIMFSTSLILFCLGVIGNYLYKLYQLQQNKPPYSIKKII